MEYAALSQKCAERCREKPTSQHVRCITSSFTYFFSLFYFNSTIYIYRLQRNGKSRLLRVKKTQSVLWTEQMQTLLSEPKYTNICLQLFLFRSGKTSSISFDMFKNEQVKKASICSPGISSIKHFLNFTTNNFLF